MGKVFCIRPWVNVNVIQLYNTYWMYFNLDLKNWKTLIAMVRLAWLKGSFWKNNTFTWFKLNSYSMPVWSFNSRWRITVQTLPTALLSTEIIYQMRVSQTAQNNTGFKPLEFPPGHAMPRWSCRGVVSSETEWKCYVFIDHHVFTASISALAEQQT